MSRTVFCDVRYTDVLAVSQKAMCEVCATLATVNQKKLTLASCLLYSVDNRVDSMFQLDVPDIVCGPL